MCQSSQCRSMSEWEPLNSNAYWLSEFLVVLETATSYIYGQTWSHPNQIHCSALFDESWILWKTSSCSVVTMYAVDFPFVLIFCFLYFMAESNYTYLTIHIVSESYRFYCRVPQSIWNNAKIYDETHIIINTRNNIMVEWMVNKMFAL